MKNKIYLLIIIGIVFVLLTVGLSGCIDEKSKFIGRWQSEGGDTTLDFDNNNSVAITGEGPLGNVELTGNFEYSVGDEKITFSSGSFGITLNYYFPESNKIILSNDQGNSVIFNKQ